MKCPSCPRILQWADGAFCAECMKPAPSPLSKTLTELEADAAAQPDWKRDATAAEWPIPATMPEMPEGLDCGDNSCMYARNKGGMRTNGGCRCQLVFRHMGGDLSIDMHIIRRALRAVGLHIVGPAERAALEAMRQMASTILQQAMQPREGNPQGKWHGPAEAELARRAAKETKT